MTTCQWSVTNCHVASDVRLRSAAQPGCLAATMCVLKLCWLDFSAASTTGAASDPPLWSGGFIARQAAVDGASGRIAEVRPPVSIGMVQTDV
jgi:hypothetical protein